MSDEILKAEIERLQAALAKAKQQRDDVMTGVRVLQDRFIAAEAALATARNDALEEAASELSAMGIEDYDDGVSLHAANMTLARACKAIRSLKTEGGE
jgi:hypothetical protein